jgi:UDP-N-acetyl-D-mannosaminuronic acid transferase (WecB/TagA/CpsF family)
MLDFSLLQKLYLGSRTEAVRHILDCYKEQGSWIINFLYFANLAHQRLVEWTPEPWQKAYLDALMHGDFLFADGIALQLFYRWFAPASSGKMPENLNGTDLNPFLIETVLKESTVSLYLYQCYDPPKGKTKAFLQTGIDALQNRFPTLSLPRAGQCLFREKGNDFDRKGLEDAVAKDNAQVKIFFNCTWTPFQEVWVAEHEKKLRDLGFLVINAWGTIDYLTWFEQRAPNRVVKARVLETLRRIITKPGKNLKKFLRMFGFFRILSKNVGLHVKKLLQLMWR